MMQRTPYSFSILRYIHDITSEEFINVGIVLAAHDRSFVSAKININYGRAKKIFPTPPPTHYSGGILLLCEDGLKIYNVTVDGVTGYSQMHLGYTAYGYWVTTQATVNDMYNITVSNTLNMPIYINRPIKNCSFINVANRDINNVYDSCIFKTGSLNVLRKYYNGNFEFFATV